MCKQKYFTRVSLASLFLLAAFFGCYSNSLAAAAKRIVLKADAGLWFRSLDSARAQVGVKEQGNNRGAQVEKYLASVGLPGGYPYCMAGQYWAFSVAACHGQTIPLYRTGGTALSFNKAREVGRTVKYVPQVGDLIYWKIKTSASGHVERIIELGRKGWVKTIAFNTGPGAGGSQREGQGVFVRRRNATSPLGRMYLRGLVGRDDATNTGIH